MSNIATSKWGDCTRCPAKNCACVKIGKDLICLNCNKEIKTEQQLEKSKIRNKVRQLGNKQVQEGNYEDAGRQALINDLDFVVSRYVRMLYAEPGHGMLQCWTCNCTKHFSLMQNGHFISRSHMQTRFLLKNLRPQCAGCNEGKHGNLVVFAERLEAEEKGVTHYLKELSVEPYKYSLDELKQMLIDFRSKLRLIEQKFV